MIVFTMKGWRWRIGWKLFRLGLRIMGFKWVVYNATITDGAIEGDGRPGLVYGNRFYGERAGLNLSGVETVLELG